MVIGWFWKKRHELSEEVLERGLVLFHTVEQAIAGEKALKKAGITCRLVAPPPHLRKGCDVGVEIVLMEQTAVEKVLKEAGTPFIEVVHPKGERELLNIEKVTRLDNYVMVKAGNMKLTFDKNTGIIVNISGGGCPDIPYLYSQLVDKHLEEVTRPKELGRTLCALMLDRGWERALALWKGEELCSS
ncbi:DUF3343 domain-containing protein [Aceticella autotrophica]|uniref:DUF3343 domain-containing protein n=1 Tax=Aceticella autotrophica TaxID=2755338 RepID=A0A975AVX2_9THEO|nr:DUF3343 domain-containing protein [Aceticella autotrophica]QSZ27457.1 DUF3343 domain-containing protein [Aceticella autotrophica]